MDRCPSEIWTEIFSLLCTDDGRMGCTLSRVSSYFSSALSSVQLQSIALIGPRQMARFSNILPHLPPERRIRNLFISTSDPRNTVQSNEQGQATRRQAVEAMRIILALAAASISNLSIAFTYSTYSIPFPSEMPNLRDLTLRGPSLPLSFAGVRPVFRFLPALKRLHLSSCKADVFQDIWAVAPELSHLRISGIGIPIPPGYIHTLGWKNPIAGVIQDSYNAMFSTQPNNPAIDEQDDRPSPLSTSKLELVLLQPAASPVPGVHASANFHARILGVNQFVPRQLRQIERNNDGVAVLPAPPSAVTSENWTDALDEWMEINEGCSTCWQADRTRLTHMWLDGGRVRAHEM